MLFIDARKMGSMVDRTHRELTDEDVGRIANTYHAWRGESGAAAGEYEDIAGFCRGATLDEVRKHGHMLTPGRYVGAVAQEDDGEPFGEKMTRLVAHLREQQAEGSRLDAMIARNLEERYDQQFSEVFEPIRALISAETEPRERIGFDVVGEEGAG